MIIWNNTQRHNYRYYSDDPVPLELEKRLDETINACPIQRSGHEKVKIIKTTQDDRGIKELLSYSVFKNNNTGLTELATITAPLVYFCCQSADECIDYLHAGIIGGAMMAETLNYGYDFSFIGCTEPTSPKVLRKINKCLRTNYGITRRVSEPFLAFCIGKGRNRIDSILYPDTYVLRNNIKVNYDPVINREDPKPQVLFVKKS